MQAARWRLAARFAGLVFVLLVAGGAAVYSYVRRALIGAFDTTHELAIQSVLESVSVRGATVLVDAREFHEEFEELRQSLGVTAVALWDAQGKELARAPAQHPSWGAAGPRRELLGDGPRAVVVRREPLGDGGRSGLLLVSRRAGDILAPLASLRRSLLLLVPLTALGALAVGWVMAGQSLRPVQRAFDQQRAFMADASHELRTPLAIIRAQAEVSVDAGDEGLRPALAVILRTVTRLGSLVDDLLFLSRADAEALRPQRQLFFLDDLVEEALEAFQTLARAKGSWFVLVVPRSSVEIHADPGQIHRLLAILLDNALRHGDPGLIRVIVERGERGGLLLVEDSGPGLPPGQHHQMFERFVRGERAISRGIEGHGLGLAVARSIALAHGGTIVLSLGDRGGTLVTVSLPGSMGSRS